MSKGKLISVPDQGVAQLIKDAYLMCEQYQWAREFLTNSIEAGATSVFFGVDPQGLRKTGVARRFVADNGHGMTPEQLEVYLSQFGGGGKTIGEDANRGIGSKASAYEWNSFGIVTISWTPEYPDGAMVWVHRNSDGAWEQRAFDIADEDGDIVDVVSIIVPGYRPELDIDFAQFKSADIERAGHGTVVLFLGDSVKRDTANGDFLRDENSLRGVTQYLNTRFLDIPEGVTVKVVSAESGSHKDDSDSSLITTPAGKVFTLDSRTVRGLRYFIPKSTDAKFAGTAQSGTVLLPYRGREVEVEWFYCPLQANGKPSMNGDPSYGPKPGIYYRYDQSTRFATLSEAYVRRTVYAEFRKYGLATGLGEFWLIVHAPEWHEADSGLWGVVPQSSRSMLVGQGGIPDFESMVTDFSDLFWDRANDVKRILRDKNSGASSADPEDRAKRLQRTITRLADRMRPTKFFKAKDPDKATANGVEVGETAAGPNTRGGSSDSPPRPPRPPRPPQTGRGGDVLDVQVNVDQGGAIGAAPRKVSVGVPDVIWDREQFVNAGISHLGAMFEPKGLGEADAGVIYLNPDFFLFETEFKYWTEKWSKAKADDVVALVKVKYEDEVVSRVQHVTRVGSQKFPIEGGKMRTYESTDEYKEMLTPTALTASLLGLVNVEQWILTAGGARFGRAKRSGKGEAAAA